jgi:methyltransferase (TIGR00027 family)
MSIHQISDTSRWMAYVRALESQRPDALFRDAFASRLAGEAGEAIAREIGDVEFIAQSIAVRTAVMDELILETVQRNEVDLVLNLAAGLDTRPWRLALPPELRWVDVDLPHVLEFKAGVIGREPATCKYESLPADITAKDARAEVLQRCSGARRALIVTEGFLVYLSPTQVSTLARDLHAQPSMMWWLTDLTGPRALEMLQRVWGPRFPGAKFQFAPADSADFFQRLNWREVLFRSSQEEDKRLKRGPRAPLLSRVVLWLSPASFREEMRRLSGIALLARDEARTSPVG